MNQHLRNLTDPLVGIVQCGNKFLIGCEISLVLPVQMAGKQVQRIVVYRNGGSLR
jgi:hypothetical protein